MEKFPAWSAGYAVTRLVKRPSGMLNCNAAVKMATCIDSCQWILSAPHFDHCHWFTVPFLGLQPGPPSIRAATVAQADVHICPCRLQPSTRVWSNHGDTPWGRTLKQVIPGLRPGCIWSSRFLTLGSPWHSQSAIPLLWQPVANLL